MFSVFRHAASNFRRKIKGDLFWDKVVFLLHGEGAHSGQIFTDEKGHTITGYGAATNTSQKKFGQSSIHFGPSQSSGNRLIVNLDSSFTFGTGDFTMECFIYLLEHSGAWGTFLYEGRENNDPAPYLIVTPSGGVDAGIGGGTVSATTPNSLIALNRWHHIAYQRRQGVLEVYVDGVLHATRADARAITPPSTARISGAFNSASTTTINGFIDEFRITRDVARYSGNFTVPTEPFLNEGPDTYWEKVALLMHMNGAAGTTEFKDETERVWTKNGNVVVSTAQSAMGGASAYFDGSRGYLTCGTVPPALQIGTGDFTIEFFLNLADTTPQMILGNLLDGTGTGHFWLMVNPTYQGLHTFGFGTPNGNVRFGSTTFPTNVTKHVAIVRKGTELKCYIDGVQYGATGVQNNFTGVMSNVFRIGASSDSVPQYPLKGYLDELRVTKGVARYSSNFGRPVREFTNYGVSATKLLIHADSTSFVDSSEIPQVLSGNATYVADPKFGSGAIAISGAASSYLRAVDPLFQLGSNDFTFEFFIKATGTQNGIYDLIASIDNESNGQYGGLMIFPTGVYGSFNGASWGIDQLPLGVINDGTYHHIAIVRHGTTFQIFNNGVSTGAVNIGTMAFSARNPGMLILGTTGVAGKSWDCKLDEVRFTNKALYTAAFTPPVSPFSV